MLFRLGNKIDVKIFGILLVGTDFSVKERGRRLSFGPLRRTVGAVLRTCNWGQIHSWV